MSDYEDPDYEEFTRDFTESQADPDDLQPEDVLDLVLVNKVKGTKVSVILKDEDGDEVSLTETISQLIKYVQDKVSDPKGNQFVEQIVPMMSQSVVSGLGRMIGIRQTAFYLSNPTTRMAIIYMMSVGLLLLKFVQENNLVIHTHETEVSPEEIENLERKTKVNDIAMMGSAIGLDPRQILQGLVDRGELSADDIREIMEGNNDDNKKS